MPRILVCGRPPHIALLQIHLSLTSDYNHGQIHSRENSNKNKTKYTGKKPEQMFRFAILILTLMNSKALPHTHKHAGALMHARPR